MEVWTSTNATATALTAPTTRTTVPGVPSGMLLDCRGQDGGGVVVSEGASGSMRISLVSSTSTVTVQSEPGLLSNASAAHGREQHHVAAVVDGGPQLVSFVADAKFADGGAAQVFGYTFFKAVGDLNQAGGHSEVLHALLGPVQPESVCTERICYLLSSFTTTARQRGHQQCLHIHIHQQTCEHRHRHRHRRRLYCPKRGSRSAQRTPCNIPAARGRHSVAL